MFPTDKSNAIKTSSNADDGIKRSFKFDFDQMKFVVKDGKVNEIEKKNAVLQWCKTFLLNLN